MKKTLYKQDSKGKIREWSIISNVPQGTYIVEYGELGGKLQQTTVHVQKKNVGKSNETTLNEQAELEANSLWKKQKDKGYREIIVNSTYDIKLKRICNTELQIAKRYLPMLAKSFKDDGHKITFPCFYQEKFDGIRCLAYLDETFNTVELLSRKGKKFPYLPHIDKDIFTALTQHKERWVLDGELFSNTLDFQTITSIVRKAKIEHPRASEIEYHVYDCFDTGNMSRPYEFRMNQVAHLLRALPANSPVKIAKTAICEDEEHVASLLAEHEKLGHEGIMLRNKAGIYENDRRSPNLQKVKSFQDAEFEIVGGKEGIGKFTGMCIFRCKCAGGEFDVMPMGTEEVRRQYWKDLPSLIGQQLTVKYFELSNDGIPRFPVGLKIKGEME